MLLHDGEMLRQPNPLIFLFMVIDHRFEEGDARRAPTSSPSTRHDSSSPLSSENASWKRPPLTIS